MSEHEYRTKDGDVLDKICAVFYRRDDMLEAVYARNPHLFGLGCRLPVGVKIVLPPAPAGTEVKAVVSGGLWGDA